MNLYLHNIGDIDGDNFISPADALIAASPITYDYVLANPPFGKKSSQTFTNEEGDLEKDDLTYNRQDFWATTSNKQLNFVQHIRTMLKTTGLAAVLVPDNVLFVGGAVCRYKSRYFSREIVTVQGGYGTCFCRQGTNFIACWRDRGTRFLSGRVFFQVDETGKSQRRSIAVQV